jgi:rubredoxin-NAD+ reductase
MSKYKCTVCGWEYDEEAGFPDGGISPGTKFEELPEDFTCPYCKAAKDKFKKIS